MDNKDKKGKFCNASSVNPNATVHILKESIEFDKIKPVTYKEIISSKPSPTEYIMSPWLPRQGIAFVYAATGVGKTLFTLNVAYAVAMGGKFLKYSCPKPRKIMYVDGEMSYNEIHSRLTGIIKQQGNLFFEDNFYLFTPEKSAVALPKICSKEGQAFYNKKMDELDVDVLFLDNLSVLSVIDENNSEQWKIIQDWFISLRARGKTVVAVHHAGKDKKGYRGTSRMLDCVDTAISLQDVSQDQLENEITSLKKFKIEYQKNRSFCGQEAIPFEVTLGPSGWAFQSMEQTMLEKVVERLKIKMTHRDIGLELGKSRPYISKLARKARLLRLIDDE